MKVCKWVVFAILLVTFSCTYLEDKDTIDISIKTNAESIIDSAEALTMTIFGFDANIADQAATPLYKESKEITKLPYTWVIKIDEEWNQKIEPNTGTKSELRFYISIESTNLRIDFKNTNDGKGPKVASNISDLEQILFIEKKPLQ